MEETRISAKEARPGMVWWLSEPGTTVLVVRVVPVRQRGWMAPKYEISTYLVDEESVYYDTHTYEPWELFISGAVLLRGPRDP